MSCSRGPLISDRNLSDKELIEQSQIVAVGTVEEIKWDLSNRHRHCVESAFDGNRFRDRPLYWFPVNVHITVENILRGDLKGSSADYTYWLPSGPVAGEWNSLMEGARYVHFLRRDGVGLRAVTDFWPSAIRVTTGRHLLASQSGNLKETITRLLWQPGVDFDITRFEVWLALRDGVRLNGWPSTLSLARDGDPRIRLQACDFLRGSPEAETVCQ